MTFRDKIENWLTRTCGESSEKQLRNKNKQKQ